MKCLKLIVLFVSFLTFIQLLTLSLVNADYFPQFSSESENSVRGRKEYANILQSRIIKIYNSIPTPSPKETEWIINELNNYRITNNNKLFNRLRETKEFSFYEAKLFFSNINNTLSDIMESASLESEMLGWVVLIERLLKSEGNEWNSVYDLYAKGYIDKKLIAFWHTLSPTEANEYESKHLTFANNCEIVSMLIISNIIRPYFEKLAGTK